MPTRRWKCALTFRGKFLLKRTEADTREEYSACVKFIRRSKSIVQMMWSRESDVLDPALCEDRNLDLDDWLLVSYKLLYKDYTPSPFRGGYSMRITDSELGENGCMFVKQRTLTVASWKHDKTGDHFVVLRRADDEDLYCLRAPDTDESHMNAFLFTDLMCKTDHASSLMRLGSRHGARFLVLHLLRYVYKDLCDDEYPQCSTVTCNSHIRHECHKTCKVCDAENPPATCSYPKRLRGSYYQTDINGYRQVNVTDSEFTVEKLGTFRCVVFPDSPSRRHRIYTTVSTFHNGCRPRYTCLRFKRRGPSVLRYTLSRSYIWPDLEKDFGQSICSDTQFGMDPEPIGDLYRSPEDTGKPIISHDPQPERVPCNLSSTFTITATFPNGSVCYGSLHEHCEDKTRLRIEFHPLCGEIIETGITITSRVLSESQSIARPVFTDYSCMAHFEGHYWERLLLLQNDHNEKEASCLLFTQLDASESLQMVAGQCDKNSWNYARAGLRVPLLSLRLRPDNFPCKYLPYVPSTTTLSSVTSSHVGGSESSVGIASDLRSDFKPAFSLAEFICV
nr:hypothetical protein BaRGS_033353 [Batillaria attramentaria]